jgi:hypothetical protein
MPKTSNDKTSFSLTYRSEAMIPAEVGMPTTWFLRAQGTDNDVELRLNLDLLEEQRMVAIIREARHKREIERYYNSRVKKQTFKVGEFMLRRNEASRVENQGKLGPRWEGPYKVKEVGRNGAYKLSHMDGREVPRTWNGAQYAICNSLSCNTKM